MQRRGTGQPPDPRRHLRAGPDVVTGIIKANFPTRISFMLRSKPDSMTILGTVGAEALLGMGDMLIMPPTSAHLQRVHGCFVSEHEIKKVVEQLRAQGTPVYDESILKPRDEEGAGEGGEEEELPTKPWLRIMTLSCGEETLMASISIQKALPQVLKKEDRWDHLSRISRAFLASPIAFAFAPSDQGT